MSALPEDCEVSSILLQSGRGGDSRVFIVQTRNRAEVGQVEQLFQSLEPYCSVRALAIGVITAFAIQTEDELPLLDELETILKDSFKFSVVHGGFNAVIHRIVEDFAVQTDSRIFPLPICQGCHDAVPFPVRLTLQGPTGKARAKAVLCERCVASMGGDQEAEDICKLIHDPGTDLSATAATSVVRKRGLLRHAFSRAVRPRRSGRSQTVRRRARKSGITSDSSAIPETQEPIAVPIRLAS